MRAQQEPIPVSLFNNVLLAVALGLALLAPAPVALAVGDAAACSALPAIAVGDEVGGTLDAVGDCFQSPPNRLIDNYSLTLAEPATLDLALETLSFGGVIGLRHPPLESGAPGQFIGQRGRSTAGIVTAHYELPAGNYVVYVTSQATHLTTPPTGDYTLDLSLIAEPQAACESGVINATSIVIGSSASASISTADCVLGPREGLETSEVPRNVDGYALFAPANQLNQVTVSADFDYRIEHYEAVAPNPPQLMGFATMPAGSVRHFALDSEVAATHLLNIAAMTPGGTGSYTLTVQDYPAQQHSALMDLYTATLGTAWTNNSGWGGAQGSECSWYGITCDGTGAVTQLVLDNNNLVGTLPESLGVLNRVGTLSLANNALSGSLPASLGYMNDLRYLRLNNNQLSGPLPEAWAYADILVELRLGTNQLSGQIPEWMGQKEHLEVLGLPSNQFSGPVPASLAELPALDQLLLQNNQLSGVLPEALFALELTQFTFDNNRFELRDPLERPALLAFFAATNGESWTNKTGWGGEPGTECTWYGVSCANGHVQGLSLVGNGLSGPLPAELGDLIHLQQLSLGNNQLSGAIPAELAQLTAIRGFYLWGNQLTGSIPAWLGERTTLQGVSLSSNQLTGTIPENLAQLTQLTSLHLSGNQLSGTIPAALATLPALTNLHLQFNQLTGAVPQALLDKTFTEFFYNNNPFDLTNPLERAALLALYTSTNGAAWTNKTGWGDAAGTECTWFGVSCSDGHVVRLVLGGNQLAGTLPAELGNLTSLTELSLGNNALTGTLPQAMTGMAALQHLYLWGNQFSGAIPTWLSELDTLKALSLSANQFSGPIPAELGDLALLETLHLGGNQLTGEIPESLAGLANLRELFLNHNQLIGYVPEGLEDIDNLQVNNNPFSMESAADRAALDALYAATDGANWLNNTGWSNELPGTLCQRYGVSCISGRVSALNLQIVVGGIARGNGLVGPLPAALGQLSELRTLNLPHNELQGPLPDIFATLPQLRSLNLSGNRLTGTLPDSLGTLLLMQHLQLAGNQLTGSIPASLGNLTAMLTLNLSFNQLSGSIPATLGSASALTTLLLQTNQLSGALPPELGNLGNLVTFNASVNLLSGSIPSSFGNLDKLTSLSLTSNHLSGSIPAELADMAELVNLNLALNDLSGPLPAAFGSAPKLSGLRVPYNQLTGPIPAELGNSPTLRALQLQNNQFSGELPAALAQSGQLMTLWAQDNLLEGSFPAALAALDTLIEADVRGNALTQPALGNAEACSTPGTLIPGQSVSGTLDLALDCVLDAQRIVDRFQLSLPQATIFTATAGSPDYAASTGLRSADDATALVAANSTAAGTPVALQYALPAGQYPLFTSTYASRPVAPFDGDYELTLSAAQAEPQDGCTAVNPTVVVPGSAVSARLQANDCVSIQLGDDGRANDRYTIGLQAGEQVWISVTGDIDLRHSLRASTNEGWLPVAITEPQVAAGATDVVVFEALGTGMHTFSVMPARVGETGSYSLYFATHAPLPQNQRDALFTLYESSNGDLWTRRDGWLGHPGTECTWYGITCTDGVVTGIDLSANALVGTIPAALGALSGLQVLNLADNNLAGVVPDVFGSGVTVNVEGNPLDNTLPAQIVSRGGNDVFYLRSGNMLSFYYTTSDAEEALTGLGLSVHVDSSVVESVRFVNVLGTALVGYDSSLANDTGNTDNDAGTDKRLAIAWADVGSQWPGSLPVKLFDLELKALPSATVASSVRIGFARTGNASQYRLTLPTVVLSPVLERFDVDGDGSVQALSDGLMLVRDMFEFTGDALIAQAIAAGSTNTTAAAISTRLAQLDPALDVDRNGTVDALTDGLLVLRYLFGFRGDVLVNDALGEGATRSTAAQIEAYLAGFSPL